MTLAGFHLEVAQILGTATGSHGFALGGGYALQVHEVADRPSKDLDAYVNSLDTSVFERAEHDLCEQLRAAGLRADVLHTDSWFRAISVTRPSDGEQVLVDLGYDYRQNPSVTIEGIGPVLDLDDVIMGKVRAFVERGAERDFSDIDRIIATGCRTPTELLQLALDLFPEFNSEQFGALLRQALHLDPAEYSAIGLGRRDVRAMHARLMAAADSVSGAGGAGG